MDSHGSGSLRRMRRNSRSVLQHLLYRGVHGGDRDTPTPAQPRDAKMIQSIASLIRAKSKLLLLENPDTVEIYKLDEPTPCSSRRPVKGNIHLPAITAKASSLNSVRGALSQSCPYLYDKRRGSLSSLTSQQTGGFCKKQSYLKAKGEAKKSNVAVTMTYLGRGHRGSGSEFTQDELRVLQQVNGGENICVFKGLLTPGEQFQFVSQRHRGYPFSITLYINSVMATRLSSCCEYRYAPGFQQGRKSCFRLTWLAGGIPCYRCTSLRNKYSSCQQLNNGTKENLILPLEQNTGNGTIESCPSSPLFIPAKPKKKSARRTRKPIKEGGEGSTDSEGPAVAGNKETSKKKRCRGQINQKESKGEMAGNNRGEEQGDSRGSYRSTVTEESEDQTRQLKTTSNVTPLQAERKQPNKTQKILNSLRVEDALTKKIRDKQKDVESDGKSRDGERRKDFNEECLGMSTSALNRGPNKRHFKANNPEKPRLQRKPMSRPKAQSSNMERSADSDVLTDPDGKPEEKKDVACQSTSKEEPVKEADLQAQLEAMMTVLSTSDEVEQLVLRNTDLTDDLLLSLAGVLKSSPSEVTLLNLNLNLIGPYGAHILLDVLRVKPQVKALHLFGNKLCDHGVLTLLTGIAEIQEQTASVAASIQQALLFPAEQNVLLQLPTGWSSLRAFVLLELDVGRNGLGSRGVKVIASFMRSHSHLQYLGLAQTSNADLAAWKELFDSLKGNRSLTQIILDENNLGDPGVRLLADMLKENTCLRQVDLDRNGISDLGGNDVMGALLCRTQVPLRHLSLQENNISEGLMSRIQEQLKKSK